MKKNRNIRRKNKGRKIPEALGNRVCGVWPYAAALVFDAVAHGILLISFGPSAQIIFRLFFSFVFFIYPLYFAVDSLWSLRPSVCGILSGEIAINRKYYMNTVQKEVLREDLLPVTVSIPVYLEGNEVIFETIRQSLAAVKRYREFSKAPANVVVSDDGLAPLLGGKCTEEKAESVLLALKNGSSELTKSERQAAERILFYKTHHIAFVVRPAKGRAGLFKKASNLNYTLRLGRAMEEGGSPRELFKEGGTFEGGYADGEILNHEVILLLDKDSGVKEGIIEAILPEFAAEEKLAYVQCATSASNLDENYYTYATGRHINNLFHNIWPCKALQGFFVPLVGHNVFIRRSLLEKSGLWAEDKVSEDYDKALSFYRIGCHGKYAQIPGLEFTECASRTFAEETGKQHRYAYGMYEMLFDGTLSSDRLRGLRGCDVFYMLLYFCSILNQALLLPTVLLESYFGNIHLLWAGFLCCMLCFITFPLIRSLIMRHRLPEGHVAGLWHTLVISVSFVGHAYSVFSASLRYLANKIRANNRPFPSTNVDDLRYSFADGVKIILQYIRKNPLFPVIAFLCLDRGVFLVTQRGLEPMTGLTYSYILFCAILVPVLLTPPLFAGFFRKTDPAESEAEITRRKRKGVRMSTWRNPRHGGENRELSPVITKRESFDPARDDIEEFLADYQAALRSSFAEDEMPEELLTEYSFESCLRKDPQGQKELYLLKRKADGVRALLRVTKDNAQEDALEEAKVLNRLDYPGIPKVFSCFEKKEKNYLVREYIEGHTLYEIVSARGSLSAEDIFGIAKKLAEILCYLHAQTPPVIHRDIKPQNIILGRDGSIYLIDFGIAREQKSRRRQDTSIILTLDYASPEQYGFEQTTPLSDIYSFGVVMLYLATGRTIRSDLESQITQNRLREVIEECIVFNPKARIQSAAELLKLLQKEESPSAKRKRIVTAAACAVAAAVCLSAASYVTGFSITRKKAELFGYDRGYEAGYADGYDAVPGFPLSYRKAALSGNTDFSNMSVTGGAFAAEGDGLIFYITDGGIWSMTASGADPKMIVQAENASSLSVRNGWLYYTLGDSILQTNIYTSRSDILYRGGESRLYVTAEDLYAKTEKGIALLDTQRVSTEPEEILSECEALHISGEYLYFTGKNDQALYRYSLSDGKQSKLLPDRVRSFCLLGDELFCAVARDGEERILRLSAGDGESEVFLEAQADMLHVLQDGICFLDLSDSRIYRCSADGRIRQRLSANPALDFNLAGDWVFYHNQENGGKLWCVRLNGANDHPLSTGR